MKVAVLWQELILSLYVRLLHTVGDHIVAVGGHAVNLANVEEILSEMTEEVGHKSESYVIAFSFCDRFCVSG